MSLDLSIEPQLLTFRSGRTEPNLLLSVLLG